MRAYNNNKNDCHAEEKGGDVGGSGARVSFARSLLVPPWEKNDGTDALVAHWKAAAATVAV